MTEKLTYSIGEIVRT